MLNPTDDVLPLLRCPITKQRLVRAKSQVLEQANRMIYGGTLRNRIGEIVDDILDEGLISEGGAWLYAVRDGIVCLLVDEAISLHRLSIENQEVDV